MVEFRKIRTDLVDGEAPRPLTKRDSFVLPVEDHQLIEVIRRRATPHLGITPNKNEVLRVALHTLACLETEPLKNAFSYLDERPVPKGRPRKRLR